MEGKVCLVTGSTSGIGTITALSLAQKGATIVLAGRSPEKLETTLSKIKNECPQATVDTLLADLSSMEQVKNLANSFKEKHKQLDVLVNNAGALFSEQLKTVDGYEMTLATNHLSYFLLTNLLLDTLKNTPNARIVNVSSMGHYYASLKFLDDLNLKYRKYNGTKVYMESKLANVLFTYELANKLEGTGVTANCLHPGAIGSNFATNNPGLWPKLMALGKPFLLTPEQGAQTSIYLASSREVEGISGKYFDKKKPKRSSKASYNRAAQKRLWRLSEELTQKQLS